MLSAHAAVVRRLDADLRERHGISLTAYEVLMLVGDAPRRRMRVSELSGATLLSVSGVSRLVDRLVREGLVRRGAVRGRRPRRRGRAHHDGPGPAASGSGEPPGRGAVGVPRPLHRRGADRPGASLGAHPATEGAGGWEGFPTTPPVAPGPALPAHATPVRRRGRVAADRSRRGFSRRLRGCGLHGRNRAVKIPGGIFTCDRSRSRSTRLSWTPGLGAGQGVHR